MEYLRIFCAFFCTSSAHTRNNLDKMTRKNYAAHDDVKAMQTESIKVQNELLPLLQNNIAELKLKVEKYGIEL